VSDSLPGLVSGSVAALFGLIGFALLCHGIARSP
jgi:hypothetical protein